MKSNQAQDQTLTCGTQLPHSLSYVCLPCRRSPPPSSFSSDGEVTTITAVPSSTGNSSATTQHSALWFTLLLFIWSTPTTLCTFLSTFDSRSPSRTSVKPFVFDLVIGIFRRNRKRFSIFYIFEVRTRDCILQLLCLVFTNLNRSSRRP